MSDKERIRGTTDKDYSIIIDKYKDLAFTIALKITKNEQESEEIVQDSFVKVFQNLSKFKNDSQFSTWFYRIVYNTSLSAIRKGKISTSEFNSDQNGIIDNNSYNNVDQILNRQDIRFIIQTAMNKLNELDFTILSLYYYENKSLKEISFITGKKRNYLKVLLQRARIKLLDQLNDSVKSELRELL